MLKKHPDGYYQSTLLQPVAQLVHAYSTRGFGDLKNDVLSRRLFLERVDGVDANLVLPAQVHGSMVTFIDGQGAETVPRCDGLVAGTGKLIGVTTADCVPILAVEPEAGIVAAVHAGWKGTLEGIAQNMIDTMQVNGASANRILVSFGPRIGACCYTAPEERARRFLQGFGDEKVSPYFEGSWHVDLAYANFLILVKTGVIAEHIDTPPLCTSCQVSEFFSYRKDSKETFGEIMGVIGWK